jgi:hypothetical protein
LAVDVKNSLIIGVCLIIAAAVLGFAVSPRPGGQEPPRGRFQVAGSPGHAFVLDTATGQVWEKFEGESGGETTTGFSDPKLKGNP